MTPNQKKRQKQKEAVQKQFMQSKGMKTVYELANNVGVSASTASNWISQKLFKNV